MRSSLLGQLLQGASGQPFVVENNASARGLIAASAVARAAGGCTLLITTNSPILQHLRSSRTSLKKRVDIVRVAYRSNPPAVTDLMAAYRNDDSGLQRRTGEGGYNPSDCGVHAEGNCKLPDVPTLAETVMPCFDILAWAGMLARANTPPNVVDRLADALRKILVDPRNVERFADIGTRTRSTASLRYSATDVKTDPVKCTSVAKEARIEPE
jgi:tripartite-type tricarboxylate transporter receptor subunit TctC